MDNYEMKEMPGTGWFTVNKVDWLAWTIAIASGAFLGLLFAVAAMWGK